MPLSRTLQRWYWLRRLVQQIHDESRIPTRKVDAREVLNDDARPFDRRLYQERIHSHTDHRSRFFQLVDDGLRHPRGNTSALDRSF